MGYIIHSQVSLPEAAWYIPETSGPRVDRPGTGKQTRRQKETIRRGRADTIAPAGRILNPPE